MIKYFLLQLIPSVVYIIAFMTDSVKILILGLLVSITVSYLMTKKLLDWAFRFWS